MQIQWYLIYKFECHSLFKVVGTIYNGTVISVRFTVGNRKLTGNLYTHTHTYTYTYTHTVSLQI
jgi:hypothetical protein